jgi:ABC-type multidrug transport system fused ATPase/permease subunit
VPIADLTLGHALLTVLEIFVLVAWFWVLITIIGDLFRDHEMSGWGKAAWVFLIFLPFLGVLIYLVARGSGMRDRALADQAEVKRQFESYVRDTAGTSPADELTKRSELKDKGAISQAEYEQAKAKLLG